MGLLTALTHSGEQGQLLQMGGFLSLGLKHWTADLAT